MCSELGGLIHHEGKLPSVHRARQLEISTVDFKARRSVTALRTVTH